MVCLLCNTVLTTLKKANANEHYLTHKEHKYFNLEDEPQPALQKLKNEKHHQQASFSAFVKKNTTAVADSYKIAHILGKRGKPFSDNHNRSTARISSKCNGATRILQNDDVYFSIALDESTDKTDSAQVLYFIRAVTKDFQCYAELLARCTVTERTRGVDIFENFRGVCQRLQLNFSNFVSVCTDGAPSMRVLQDTLDRTIAIVNYIRVNALRHREFRQMLTLDEESYSIDLPYYCKVRWLSSDETGLMTVAELPKIIGGRGRKQIGQAASDERGQLFKDFMLQDDPLGSLELVHKSGCPQIISIISSTAENPDDTLPVNQTTATITTPELVRSFPKALVKTAAERRKNTKTGYKHNQLKRNVLVESSSEESDVQIEYDESDADENLELSEGEFEDKIKDRC
ncbi:hypothetical protein CBL_20370 [Carabus blaptoides fortunei]